MKGLPAVNSLFDSRAKGASVAEAVAKEALTDLNKLARVQLKPRPAGAPELRNPGTVGYTCAPETPVDSSECPSQVRALGHREYVTADWQAQACIPG
jgi:hypothetical protein